MKSWPRQSWALLPSTPLINGAHYFATQTVNGCESAVRLDVVATVSSSTPLPVAVTPQTFCSGTNPTIASLAVTGTDIKWYVMGNGGAALPANTPLADGAGYYATQTLNGCESMPRVFVAVFVKNTPLTPIGLASQSFCLGIDPTVGNLVCSGTGIKWYLTSGGGAPLPVGTPLVSGTHYFASQTVNGCESPARLDVTATVNPVPPPPPSAAPPGPAQAFCTGDGPTLANLPAIGTGIKWYAAASGGSPLPMTSPLVNGVTYFASQTINGCESTERLAVSAAVNASPGQPSGFDTQIFCIGDAPTVASLNAVGTNLQWFAAPSGGSPLPLSTPLTDGAKLYCSQTVNGCPSVTRFQVNCIVKTPLPGHACIPGCSN